jgi:phenylalanyl-tRNA synthetase alpha chain
MAIDVKPLVTEDIAKLMKLDKQETLFSLGYWKKKGAVSVKEGKVSITKSGEDYLNKSTAEELFLKKLSEKQEIPLTELRGEEQFAFEELRKRGLSAKVEHKVRELAATDLGTKVADSVKAETRIGQLTPDIIKSGAWQKANFRRYDVTSPVPKLWPGKKQAYLRFLDEVRDELAALGFEEFTGPLVELSFWNNDALYMPQDHPARGIHDIYFVKDPKEGKIADKELLKAVKSIHENGGKSGSKGWQYQFDEQASHRLILRSHDTGLAARMMASGKLKIPGAYFYIPRVFRPEKLDQSHLMEFNQTAGFVVGDEINFRHLLGLLKQFAKKLTGSDKVRFVPGYFPFTEPSVELVVWSPELKKWLELGGAGMFRPELGAPFGITAPMIAWGIGVERLFMIRENIGDIRQLFSQDIQWLREAKL